MQFRLEGDKVLVEERFLLQHADAVPYRGKVYAWLPDDASRVELGPEGAPLPVEGGGLVSYDLAARNGSLAPGAAAPFVARWSAPLPPGGAVARRLVYPTASVNVTVHPPLFASLPGPGAGMGAEVRVQRAPAQLVEGWHLLVLLAVGLAAGAWWWDRRRGAQR